MLGRLITPGRGDHSDRHRGVAAACLFATTVLTAFVAASGCADGPTEPHRTPADRVLSDPMNYGPKAEDYAKKAGAADSNYHPGTTDSNGLQKDLDHVFNP